MNCTKCDGSTRVKYTAGVKRRRWCEVCGHRFTTIEMAVDRVGDAVPEAKPAARPSRKAAPKSEILSAAVKTQKRAEARRRIQELRELRDAGGWAYDPDLDFIPEKW